MVNESYIPRVGFGQTKPEIVDLFKKTFIKGSLFIEHRYSSGARDRFKIDMTHATAVTCAKAIEPYLILKRRQAQLIIKLGISLARPKSETTVPKGVCVQMNRWGSPMDAIRRRLSQETINEREAIFQEFRRVQRDQSETAIIKQLEYSDNDLPLNNII